MVPEVAGSSPVFHPSKSPDNQGFFCLHLHPFLLFSIAAFAGIVSDSSDYFVYDFSKKIKQNKSNRVNRRNKGW